MPKYRKIIVIQEDTVEEIRDCIARIHDLLADTDETEPTPPDIELEEMFPSELKRLQEIF